MPLFLKRPRDHAADPLLQVRSRTVRATIDTEVGYLRREAVAELITREGFPEIPSRLGTFAKAGVKLSEQTNRYKDVAVLKHHGAVRDADQRGSASGGEELSDKFLHRPLHRSAVEKNVDRLVVDSIATKQHVKDIERQMKDVHGKLDDVLAAVKLVASGGVVEELI